jgi:hypothetical protein
MIVLSTNRFKYYKDTKEFFAEISDLPQITGGLRLQDITLTSHVTGKESDWALETEYRDPDGDILYWLLRPTKNTIAVHPRLDGASIVITND